MRRPPRPAVPTGPSLVLHDVVVGRRSGVGVRIAGGRVSAIGPDVVAAPGERRLDGAGGTLLPGLHDHHVHLLALAARDRSTPVGPDVAPDRAHLAARLRAAAATAGPGGWVRAVDYHEATAGLLGRDELDAMVPGTPVRLQDRTGALWVLNSAALGVVAPGGAAPAALELDAAGRPTGRLWRGDRWLRSRLPADPPDLAPVGAAFARWGVTRLTDATATTGPEELALLAAASASGALPQRLWVMSGDDLPHPPGDVPLVAVGPVKVVLDEDRLPPPAEVVERIRAARRAGRAVAVHCVALPELVVALAAFADAGPHPGDRIEHGGVIPGALIAEVARLGLTVVTQPGFVRCRGDRWRHDVDPRDRPDLYRCRTLLDAGVPVAAGSDAPHGPADPWLAVRAAVDRRTAGGAVLGAGEALGPHAALGLLLGSPARPGGGRRRVAPGVVADLCLLRAGVPEALADTGTTPVAATVVAGAVVALDDPGRLN